MGNLGSNALAGAGANGAVKIEETSTTMTLKINHDTTDTILHDCWFGNSAQLITLNTFIGYAGGVNSMVIADEMLTFTTNPPGNNDSASGILGYAGNSNWENGVTGAG